MHKVVTVNAMMTVIDRHQLKPDANGDYRIPDELIAEAVAFDERRGEKIPRELYDVDPSKPSEDWEVMD